MEKIKNRVFKSAELGTIYVANKIKEEIVQKTQLNEKVILGLSTGASPVSLYKELIRMHKEDGLSFKNVVTFNLDEYYPMESSAVQSYARFMNENLFDHIDILKENINVPSGTVKLEEISKYCDDYEDKINGYGGIDIQILGIGRTGHIGFNEPGSGSRSFTRLVTLDQKTRRDASKDFKSIENVPRKAITMGVGTIFKSKRIYLLAWGEKKAGIIAKAIEGIITSLIPATFLQNHPKAIFVLDESAAKDLSRVTTPWLVGDCQWDENLSLKAVCWLSKKLSKAVLKLTDDDYNEFGMGDLITQIGAA